MTNVARIFDDYPPDWPEAHVKLIDALRDYIRSDDMIGRDLFQEGSITREALEKGMAAIDPMRAMLADLEKHEINPTLGLKRRRGK